MKGFTPGVASETPSPATLETPRVKHFGIWRVSTWSSLFTLKVQGPILFSAGISEKPSASTTPAMFLFFSGAWPTGEHHHHLNLLSQPGLLPCPLVTKADCGGLRGSGAQSGGERSLLGSGTGASAVFKPYASKKIHPQGFSGFDSHHRKPKACWPFWCLSPGDDPFSWTMPKQSPSK